MTDHGQDQPDQAVEESLGSWAGSSEVPAGWVPTVAERVQAPDADTVATAVHVLESSASAPVTPAPGESLPERTEPAVNEHAPATESPRAAAAAKLAADRPELVIAGAFVGGLLLATILKRLAR